MKLIYDMSTIQEIFISLENPQIGSDHFFYQFFDGMCRFPTENSFCLGRIAH